MQRFILPLLPMVSRFGLAAGIWVVLAGAGLLAAPAAPSEPSPDEDLALLVTLIAQQEDADFQLDLLRGMLEGLAGRRDLDIPPGWPELYGRLAGHPRAEIRQVADKLGLAFGDPQAAERLIKVVGDAARPVDERRDAAKALGERQYGPLVDLLLELLDDPAMRPTAVRQLARYDDPRIPQRLLEVYPQLEPAQRGDAVMTLASRTAYALALLEAVERGRVPRTDVSAFAARQLLALGEPVASRLDQVWGSIREARRDRQEQMARYQQVIQSAQGPPDLAHGRVVFERTCGKCHRLFGAGASIGPDLTGTNRVSLDYLLENVLDPNALVGRDYQLHTFVLDDGRIVSGIIAGQDAQAVRVQTVNELLVLPRDGIEEDVESSSSMMPEGQLEDLTPEEIRDLFHYLQSPQQVPLPGPPAEPEPGTGR